MVAFAATTAGCGTESRTLSVTIPPSGDFGSLPITLVDPSGSVRALEGAASPESVGRPLDAGRTPVVLAEGRDDAVVLEWTGGACDEQAAIEVDAAAGDGAITFRLTTQHGLGGCFAATVGRRLVVVFGESIGERAVFLESRFEPLPPEARLRPVTIARA